MMHGADLLFPPVRNAGNESLTRTKCTQQPYDVKVGDKEAFFFLTPDILYIFPFNISLMFPHQTFYYLYLFLQLRLCVSTAQSLGSHFSFRIHGVLAYGTFTAAAHYPVP